MIDFSSLTNNLEGSSLTNVIVIALVSFVLSSLIALTYQKTYRGIESPRYFIQSLILISIPVAMVMQAIGDSLARGLGMLGALAIIRFRTTLRNPRNMIFMFTSIAVGIATGVYGIAIAIIGTLSFCLIVLIIHFSRLSSENLILANLQFDVLNQYLTTTNTQENLEQIINKYVKKSTLSRYGVQHKTINEERIEKGSFEFKIKVENKEIATNLINKLSKEEGVSNLKVNFKDDEYEKI